MVDKKILDSIGQQLVKKKHTIAVAESVTAGLLQLSLSNIKDARKFFQGGITTFNLGQKYKHLNVEPIHAEESDCVSQNVATQMALEVCKLFTSQWGIGITCYASAVPESDNKLFCYYAIVYNGKVSAKAKLTKTKIEEGLATQEYYALKTFEKLISLLR